MRTRHIAICGLAVSTVFFPRCFKKGKIFGKKKWVIEYEVHVLIFSTTFV
jgi:hypothetical protein